MRILWIISLFFLFALSPAQAGVDHPRNPHVEIWVPPDFQTADGPWPLVIFSHGYGGCPEQSSFLTAFLADQGYIVAAPAHQDSRLCQRGQSREGVEVERTLPERPFRQPETWTDQTYRGRRDDVVFTIESLIDDPYYKDRIDADKIALIGHSLGGYTVLGMAGAWPSWKDPRIRAVVALSPYANPFIVSKTLSSLAVPVMFQGGSRDFGVTPALKRPYGGGYALAPSPKYYLEWRGANHFIWTMRGDSAFRGPINETVLSFLDHYLKDGPPLSIEGKIEKMLSDNRMDKGAR